MPLNVPAQFTLFIHYSFLGLFCLSAVVGSSFVSTVSTVLRYLNFTISMFCCFILYVYATALQRDILYCTYLLCPCWFVLEGFCIFLSICISVGVFFFWLRFFPFPLNREQV